MVLKEEERRAKEIFRGFAFCACQNFASQVKLSLIHTQTGPLSAPATSYGSLLPVIQVSL